MDAHIQYLCQMIHVFKNTASHVDSESMKHDDIDIRAAMKAVSHFNLGTALELMLKMIILRKGIEPDETHMLNKLYYDLPEENRKELDFTFDEIFKRKPMEWKSVITLDKSEPKPKDNPFASMEARPKRTNGSSLINFFEDFDKLARLSVKRYEHEDIEKWSGVTTSKTYQPS